MNGPFVKLLLTDFQLQWRYRIIAAYAVVIGLYTTIILVAQDALPHWVIAIIIYSDPAVLGFFFLGGLMMLEKSENVRLALAMSPISATQYLAAKSISLTIVAVAAVCVLSVAAQLAWHNAALVIFATICTSIMFISAGAIAALKFKTVSGYLIGSVPIITPLVAPAALLIVDPLPLFVYAIPPVAQLKLLLVAFDPEPTAFPVLGICALGCLVAATVCFIGSANFLKQELGSKP